MLPKVAVDFRFASQLDNQDDDDRTVYMDEGFRHTESVGSDEYEEPYERYREEMEREKEERKQLHSIHPETSSWSLYSPLQKYSHRPST